SCLGRATDHSSGSSASSASQDGQRQYRTPDWTGTRSATWFGLKANKAWAFGLDQNRASHSTGSANRANGSVGAAVDGCSSVPGIGGTGFAVAGGPAATSSGEATARVTPARAVQASRRPRRLPAGILGERGISMTRGPSLFGSLKPLS